MEVVRLGRRDDLIASVISRLRLAMLSDSKFPQAVALKDVQSGKYELQMLFDWQQPKRALGKILLDFYSPIYRLD